jgi:hypothetical protein
LLWPVPPADLDNFAFIKKETNRLFKEYNEKKNLIQPQKSPQQILRDQKMNVSKARAALIGHLTDGKDSEVRSEAQNIKISLELISSMLTSRVFPQSNPNPKETLPKLAIASETLARSVNHSLGKCHRTVGLLLSKLEGSDYAVGEITRLVELLDASLIECDDLLAWCVKEVHEATLAVPSTPVTAVFSAPSKKRKLDTVSNDVSARDWNLSTWPQELAAAYPHLTFRSVDQQDLFGSALHLVSSSTLSSIDFHFHLFFDLSFIPLRALVHAHHRDLHSPLSTLITPFSPRLSRHSASHPSTLHELEREINTLIQSYRLSLNNQLPSPREGHLNLIERAILCFSEGVSLRG